MQNGRRKNSIRNIFSGLFLKIIDTLFPFFVRTVFIHILGVEYLGVGGLFTSILTVLSLSELGFGSALVYNMYKPLAEEKIEEVCSLINFYRKIYTIIGVLVCSIGLIFIPLLPYLIKGECPEGLNIVFLYIIYLVNSSISYLLFGYKTSILTVLQREDIESNINAIVKIAVYSAQIIILLFTKNIYLYTIALLFGTILVNIIRNCYIKIKYSQYFPRGEISKQKRHYIFKDVIALFGNKLQSVVFIATDSMVISAFLGLEMVGIYSNYYYILSAVVAFMSVLYISIRPSIGNSVAMETVDKNYSDFETLTIIAIWISGFCSICFLCLYQDFILLWIGKKYLLPSEMPLLFAVYFFIWEVANLISVYKDATGIWWEDRFCPYISSLINLITNIILIKIIGISGVLISTIISVLFIEYPWKSYVLFKTYFKRDVKPYFIRVFIFTSYFVILGAITFLICSLWKGNTILFFVLKLLICLLIPNIIFIFILQRYKKEYARVSLWLLGGNKR